MSDAAAQVAAGSLPTGAAAADAAAAGAGAPVGRTVSAAHGSGADTVDSAVAEDVLLARAYLSRVAEPASLALWAFVREHGPVQAAQAIRAGDVPAPIDSLTSARRAQADGAAELESAERHGIRLVVPEASDWPVSALGALERVALRQLTQSRPLTAEQRGRGEPAPPLALWVRGRGELVDAGCRAAAIVGSRAASAYGERVTAELAYGLAGHGVAVVSGGAYGIDAAAHRAAMTAGGSTIIVSAGGLDRPYPAGNAALFERAAERGLVLSESPPGSAPHRHRFLSRNRLIAALSTGTVVVEAALRSGALNTAGHCVLLGRPLMVVPGPVTSGLSAGCHALLRREDYAAILVESVDHVLAVVGSIGEGIDLATAAQCPPPDVLNAILDRLDPVARRVFDGLPARTAVSAPQLAARSGMSLVEVARAVPALQVAGLIETIEGAYRISSVLRRSS